MAKLKQHNVKQLPHVNNTRPAPQMTDWNETIHKYCEETKAK